jgi:hypothetical protein
MQSGSQDPVMRLIFFMTARYFLIAHLRALRIAKPGIIRRCISDAVAGNAIKSG